MLSSIVPRKQFLNSPPEVKTINVGKLLFNDHGSELSSKRNLSFNQLLEKESIHKSSKREHSVLG